MTTPTTVSVRLQLRADTAANWTSANPTLLANELGRETDTGKIKIGNGSTAWSSLAYQAWATLPIAVASGGTGQTSYTNGQLLIGNTTGNTLTKATLTAGSGIAITNGTGSITVAASGISDAQIAADAEIAVSKLADGTARQLLQTDAAGTGVEWASNIDIPGTLDVTSAATFDSTIGASAGTASLPSITFTGDLNTGIYSPGADQVSFTTGGTERLRIDSTGQIEAVSLGTAAAPTYSFTTDANTGIYSPGADQVAISTGGTNRFQIDSSGNITVDTNTFYVDAANNRVGIGTTSPVARLDVNTAAASTAIHATDGTNADLFLDFPSLSITRFVSEYGANGQFVFANGTSKTERMRIDSSGRLLVGTSSARTNVFADTTTAATPSHQVETVVNSSWSTGLSIINNSSAGYAPVLTLGLSCANSVGSNTLVPNGNTLGRINFAGNDGTNFVCGARITGETDGTTGSGDLPTRLVFSTTADGASSPTEAMRITSKKEVLIGVTSVPTAGNVNGTAINAEYVGDTASMISAEPTTTGSYRIVFLNGNGLVGSINTSGSSTSYGTSSDYRLKENIAPVVDGITRLQQLKPSRFNFIADPGKTVDGFIAHEVQAVVPEAITGEKDAIDEDGNPIYQGIDQSKLVPLLTAALQEAIKRIETLEAEVAALKG